MTVWDDVAIGKLSRVLGGAQAQQVMAKVLLKMGLTSLASVNDLHAFAELLSTEPGFAAPVGGLLLVHATIHGASSRLVKDAS